MGNWKSWASAGGGHTRIAAMAIGVLVVVGGAMVSTPASAQTGIATTKHNLGSGGTGVNKFSGTAEICVFCHTPHGADTSAAVPLWNRTLSAPGIYTTYDSLGTSTLNGKTAPVGSVSIACLSCHDGTQSMSAVINAPGSGTGGNAAWIAGAWSGVNQVLGKIAPGLITNIGTDLRNDHPISIQYGGGGVTTSALTGPTTDPDFKVPASQLVGTTRVWWVDTEATPNTTRQKTDMALYTRAPGALSGYTGQTLSEPFVECASCHDPHSVNTTFLRIVNTGSAVCLSCHVK